MQTDLNNENNVIIENGNNLVLLVNMHGYVNG